MMVTKSSKMNRLSTHFTDMNSNNKMTLIVAGESPNKTPKKIPRKVFERNTTMTQSLQQFSEK
jgi:hypothetical protein